MGKQMQSKGVDLMVPFLGAYYILSMFLISNCQLKHTIAKYFKMQAYTF